MHLPNITYLTDIYFDFGAVHALPDRSIWQNGALSEERAILQHIATLCGIWKTRVEQAGADGGPIRDIGRRGAAQPGGCDVGTCGECNKGAQGDSVVVS
jgi:hypothetical protein